MALMKANELMEMCGFFAEVISIEYNCNGVVFVVIDCLFIMVGPFSKRPSKHLFFAVLRGVTTEIS